MIAKEDEYGFASRRIDSVRRVSLIAVETTEGSGKSYEDLVHRVTRYYDDDGNHVATSPAPVSVSGASHEGP